MKRVGIMHGRERSFPEAFCAEINSRNAGVHAESLGVDAIHHLMDRPYDVIVDRISHEVPFFQIYLKHCTLLGTSVINNPFWRIADDKYFGTVLAARLGIAVPRTYLLPQREYVKDITPESLSNLRLVDWEQVGQQVGYPCFIKPSSGGGWKSVSKCDDLNELLNAYNESGELVMMLQEGITWEAYARLIVIGKDEVLIAPWDPSKPHHERYAAADFSYSPELEELMKQQARVLNRALGYDMNTVEFAIRDGVPYAIDFTNTAPDFDAASLTGPHFQWVVEMMADMAIVRALAAPEGEPSVNADWKSFLAD